MSRTVAEKMGIKTGARTLILNASEEVVASLGLPAIDRHTSISGEFDYIHVFVTSRADLDRSFLSLKSHLAQRGMLWVSWPKGRQLGTDLTLPIVIEVGYDHGLVESKTLSIDTIWSAIKFTHPIPGKTYANSFGSLKRRSNEDPFAH